MYLCEKTDFANGFYSVLLASVVYFFVFFFRFGPVAGCRKVETEQFVIIRIFIDILDTTIVFRLKRNPRY